MPVIEQNDTKRQIIEKLNDVPADKLRSVREYVAFIAMDEDRKEWLLEPDHLTEREQELIQEALDDPRPDVSDAEVRKMLGM
jgi:phenylpyruvate tautomerase PptA (4-oxalocrotonate tautomerase family)